MMDKAIRLSKALWVESIKRLPYVGLILVIIILIQVFRTGAQVADNVRISRKNSESNQTLLEKITELSEDNKKLSEANKSLSEQNNRLADQSNRYLDCIAQLFAKYTRDARPIIITDLNMCASNNIISGQGTTNIGSSAPLPAPVVVPPVTPISPPAAPPSPPTNMSPTMKSRPFREQVDRLFDLPQSLLRMIQI